MKIHCRACLGILLIILTACMGPGEESFPPIDSLKLLPMVEVADFTQLEELAAAAVPVLTTDGQVYFYDHRLNQLLTSPLLNPEPKPIGRFGEGPGEYGFVSSLWFEDDLLYSLDSNRKIMCMSPEGELIWEEKLKSGFIRILGRNGEDFFLTEHLGPNDSDGALTFMLGIARWGRNSDPEILLSRPITTARGRAIVAGKVYEGGGIFHLSSPAMAKAGDRLCVSSGSEYFIELFDLEGNPDSSIFLKAPKPDRPPVFDKFPGQKNLEPYAVSAIFPARDCLWIISNYSQEGHFRIDKFSAKGKLTGSFLLPMEFDPPRKTVVFSDEYLIYIDNDQVGFKVYRISS